MASGAHDQRGSGALRALILAGKRGPTDPLARSLGASHRALVPIAGTPMLERVVATLFAAGVRHITVSIDEPRLVESLPGLQRFVTEGRLAAHASAESPASSVLDFLRGGGDAALPALVTTADHPLLTVQMLDVFWNEALRSRVDLAVGVVSEKTFRVRYPDMQRTFIRLADVAFSGANLFGVFAPPALEIIDFWRRAERHRKSPWRLARVFGLAPLIKFAAGRLTLGDALDTLGRTTGARAGLVELPFAEAAIDVDRPADFETASRLLAASPTPRPATPA
jgi:GTP:adenosylcobinamide-phosphate guanylyltransferase